ncbi:hypothetical protein [Azospirillum palustre]
MFSRTEKAKEVRVTLVRVFAAYRCGDLVPAVPQLPNFMNPAEAARAWAVEYEGKLLAYRIPQTFAEALRIATDDAVLVALAGLRVKVGS